MRELAKILLLIILLPVAVGQVVEPTKKEKVEEGLQIRVTGVPLAEQSPTHSHYTVDEDGMITMLKLGKVQTKGKSHSVLAKEIADAYVQAGIYKDPVVVVLGGAEEVEESWIVCESSSAWTTAEEQAKAENGSSTSVTLASFVKAHFGAKAYDNIGQVRLVRDNRGFSLNLMVDEHKNVKLDPKDRVQVSRKRLIPWTEVELSVIAVPTADNQRVTGRHKVAEDGTITMWKIGKVDTKGKTADQLAVDLKEAYVGAEIFKDPVFIVSGQPLVERQVNRKFLNLGGGR